MSITLGASSLYVPRYERDMCNDPVQRSVMGMVNLAYHPGYRRTVHVLTLQVSPANLSEGANAIVIPIPARNPLREENLIDCKRTPNVMRDCLFALRPPPPMLVEAKHHEAVVNPLGDPAPVSRNVPRLAPTTPRAASLRHAPVVMHDPEEDVSHNAYRMYFTGKAYKLADQLAKIPVEYRPRANDDMLHFLQERFGNWPLMLYCFRKRARMRVPPISLWYDPIVPHLALIPGITALDGKAPDLRARVDLSHWAFVGVNANPRAQLRGAHDHLKHMRPVHYTDALSSIARALLPTHICGQYFEGEMQNGDFLVEVSKIPFVGNDASIERGLIVI